MLIDVVLVQLAGYGQPYVIVTWPTTIAIVDSVALAISAVIQQRGRGLRAGEHSLEFGEIAEVYIAVAVGIVKWAASRLVRPGDGCGKF